MSAFFADTFYWIALANRRDSAHREVMRFTSALKTMRREGLTEALTNDRHFEQEGFRAVFR